MLAGMLEDEAAWPIGKIHPRLLGERRWSIEDRIGDWQDLVADRGMIGPRPGRLAAARCAKQRDACGSGDCRFRRWFENGGAIFDHGSGGIVLLRAA
jgi:hypothetical protein